MSIYAITVYIKQHIAAMGAVLLPKAVIACVQSLQFA